MKHYLDAIDKSSEILKSQCPSTPLAGTTWTVTMDAPYSYVVFTWAFGNDNTVVNTNWRGKKDTIPYSQPDSNSFVITCGATINYSGTYNHETGSGNLNQLRNPTNPTMGFTMVKKSD